MKGEKTYEFAFEKLSLYQVNKTYDCYYTSAFGQSVVWDYQKKPSENGIIIGSCLLFVSTMIFVGLWIAVSKVIGSCAKSPMCTNYLGGELINRYGC